MAGQSQRQPISLSLSVFGSPWAPRSRRLEGFLLTLAVADDLGAIVIIALFTLSN